MITQSTKSWWTRSVIETFTAAHSNLKRFVEQHELRIIAGVVLAVVAISGAGVTIVTSLWTFLVTLGVLASTIFTLAVLLAMGLGCVAAAGGKRTRRAFGRIWALIGREDHDGND